MSTARRIYKNTLYLGIAELVSRIMQFIVMLYAAKLLSQEDFGKFSFALALSLIAVILADMGINVLLVREVSRNRNKDFASSYVVNAFCAKIILSVITFFVVLLVLNVLNYPHDTKLIVYAIWLFTILSTFTELFYSVFRAFEMMFYDAFLKVSRMMLLVSLGLFILFKGYGVLAFSYSFVITELIIALIAAYIAARKFVNFKSIVKVNVMKSLFKKSLPFGLSAVFGMIYFFIGSVILSKIKGDAQVAIYSVAFNLALAVLFIPTVYTNAIYPVLSRYYNETKSELKILYERSFKYLYMVGLPISIGTYVLADRIIYFFYGKNYEASIIALQIIAWFLFIKFLNFLFGTVLQSIDKHNERMIGQGFTALFNIVLNIALIPKFGFIGAAWATFATEILLFFIYFSYISRKWYYLNLLAILWRPAIAATLMFVFIKHSSLGLTLTIIFSAVMYVALIIALGSFDEQDMFIIRRVLKNEKV